MSKEKHSKICSVDDIHDRVENKKWSTGDENEGGRDSVDAGDDNAKNALCLKVISYPMEVQKGIKNKRTSHYTRDYMIKYN